MLLRMGPLEFSIVLRAASVLVITWKVREDGENGRGGGEKSRGKRR